MAYLIFQFVCVRRLSLLPVQYCWTAATLYCCSAEGAIINRFLQCRCSGCFCAV